MNLQARLSPSEKRGMTQIKKQIREDYKAAKNSYHKWRNQSRSSKILLCTLFAISGGKCPVCDRDMILSFNHKVNNHPRSATLDHVEPLVKTLQHDKLNLQIMCYECNNKKGDK